MPRRPLCFERRWQRDLLRRRPERTAPHRTASLRSAPHPNRPSGRQLPRGAARRGPFPAANTNLARGRGEEVRLGTTSSGSYLQWEQREPISASGCSCKGDVLQTFLNDSLAN